MNDDARPGPTERFVRRTFYNPTASAIALARRIDADEKACMRMVFGHAPDLAQLPAQDMRRIGFGLVGPLPETHR